MIRRCLVVSLLASVSTAAGARDAGKGEYARDAAALSDEDQEEAGRRYGREVVVEGDRLTDTGVGDETDFGILGERAILDTPFSVSSFTEALIANTGARNLSDLLVRDASITADVNPAGFRDAFSIRGFPVGRGGFLYDGLPGLTPTDGYFGLYNLSRVEVFRGANAFVVGASAFGGAGGAINLVPKRPGQDDVTQVVVGYQTDAPLLAGDISRRFGSNKQFGARVTAYRLTGSGAVEQFRRASESYALYLDWKPVDTLYLAASVDRIVDRSDGYRDDIFLDPGVPVPRIPDLKRNYLQPWTFIQEGGLRYLGQASWTFVPGWTLSAGWGRFESEKSNGYFSAFGRVTNAAGDLTIAPFRSFQPVRDIETGQAILRGRFDTGAVKHTVTAGWASNWNDVRFPANRLTYAPVRSNLYSPVYVPEPPVQAGPELPRAFFQDSEVRSLVGIYELSAFDGRVSALAGVRDVRINVRTLAFAYDESKTSPFASLFAKPSATSLVYLSYNQGLERGGAAPITAVNANELLPPGTTEQYELGGKLEVGRLLLTAAVFEITRPLEFLNTERRFVQDGEQKHRGFEVQAQGGVTDALRVVTGVTCLDASIDNGTPALKGNRPIGVPKWSATAYAEYDLPPAPGLTLSAGLIREGSQFVDLQNAREVDGWTRFDLGVRYAFASAGARWTARVNVENVAERGYFSVNPSGGLQLASPRLVRASLSADF